MLDIIYIYKHDNRNIQRCTFNFVTTGLVIMF